MSHPSSNIVSAAKRLIPGFMLCLVGMATLSAADQEKRIDFNREVRPILSDVCFHCHGPDASQRKKIKTELRLDTKSGLFDNLDGIYPIVPGKPDKSEVIARIFAEDKDDVMPPPDAPKQLTAAQKETLKKWVEQGASWDQHWAFVTPTKPPIPESKFKDWAIQPIDHFIAHQLEAHKLQPSPAADRITYIRRVSLDLNGLPPTPEEVDAFVNDKRPDAYERVVDRLLNSPRYGETMAMNWLDGARFADSQGYQADASRQMWRWRDWVIDAYNNNMPFDQFTIEQLAGDLLPNATLGQKIATGFNRNHRINTEGGIIPEEWRIENVMDRVETTGTVWLGLTLNCARCHDHKYDPISQKEFYQLFSFFNTIDEVMRGGSDANNKDPQIKAPTPAQENKLAELQKAVDDLEGLVKTKEKPFLAEEKNLDKKVPVELGNDYTDGLIARFVLDNNTKDAQGAWPDGNWKDGKASFNSKGMILAGAANFTSKAYIEVGVPADTQVVDFNKPFTITAWVERDGGGTMTLISQQSAGKNPLGYALTLEDGKLQLRLIGKKEKSELRITSKNALPNKAWFHVAVSSDGSGKAAGVRMVINREQIPTKTEQDSLSDTIAAEVPLQFGSKIPKNKTRFALADVRFYKKSIDDAAISRISQQPIYDISQLPEKKRSDEQKAAYRLYVRRMFDPTLSEADEKLIAAKASYKSFYDSIQTVMIMHEMDQPRVAHILKRGQYDHPGDPVESGTPAAFFPMPKGAPKNRLGLAQWIVDPQNPLTARVAVNRMWERFFGVGLVKTTENLGSQAEPPSHPALLDYLATEFVRMGWDMKAFQRMIVLSATYRQSSVATPASNVNDPENRLLSHGPRFRLQAETLRDQALYIAGLLHEEIGGPSVKPYQPDGIWDEMSNYGNLHNYKHDQDQNRNRRSLYTIWKRTTPPPTMTIFDMASREYCVVRRSRTNTPLQALALLNDVTYIEAARLFAERMMIDGGKTPSERITYGFRRAIARSPSKDELTILVNGLEKRITHFKTDTNGAKQLLAQGDTKANGQLDPAELAAYAITASTILNLDETLTKE